MTLLSGSPLNVRLFNFQPGNAQLALDYVFARCQADPSCHYAFPHLAADWSALWASVGRSPWVIPAAQSPTKTTVRLDRDALASSIYNAMFTGNIGPIPVVVHTLAAAKNKVAALASVISASGIGPGFGRCQRRVNQMMLFEIQCASPGKPSSPRRCRISAAASPTRPTWSRPS